jgi:peroxiredoxin
MRSVAPLQLTYTIEGATMARVELNTRAPVFTMPDFAGNMVSLSDFLEREIVFLVFNRGFL